VVDYEKHQKSDETADIFKKNSDENKLQCWFCGEYRTEIFKCDKCNQLYCSTHKNYADHDCLSLFIIDKDDFNQETPDEENNGVTLPDSAITTSESDFIIPKNGRIDLDSNKVKKIVENLIQAYNDFLDDPILSDDLDPVLCQFIIKNPDVSELLKIIATDEQLNRKLMNQGVFRGLLIWLKFLGSNLNTIQQIIEKLEVPFGKLPLDGLLQYYYSHLIDVAHILTSDLLDHPFWGFIQKEEIPQIKDTVVFNREVLADLSEHARKSGERECMGLIAGKRNQDGIVIEATHYIPLTLNGFGWASYSNKELYEIMDSFLGTNENIVGTLHSHPYPGTAVFSDQDKISGFRFNIIISVYEFIKSLNIPLTQGERLSLSIGIGQFNMDKVKFLLGSIVATSALQAVLDQVLSVFLNNIRSPFETLKNKISSILSPLGLKTVDVEFQTIPTLEMIICPELRLVRIMDFDHKNCPENPNAENVEWVNYRIALKKNE
jgi:proteasome lid subunit RPN8/RPN11